MGSRELNSGPLTCTARALTTDPYPRPRMCLIPVEKTSPSQRAPLVLREVPLPHHVPVHRQLSGCSSCSCGFLLWFFLQLQTPNSAPHTNHEGQGRKSTLWEAVEQGIHSSTPLFRGGAGCRLSWQGQARAVCLQCPALWLGALVAFPCF